MAHTEIQGAHYEVLIDAEVFFTLGESRESDRRTIEDVRQNIAQEIVRRLEDDLPLDFTIPSVARVQITGEPQEGSSVLYPLASVNHI